VVTIATRSRLRYRLVALVAAGMAMEWWERKPDLDPLTFSVMAVLDDLLYCGGVWEDCVRSRRLAPLLPRTGRPKIRSVMEMIMDRHRSVHELHAEESGAHTEPQESCMAL